MYDASTLTRRDLIIDLVYVAVIGYVLTDRLLNGKITEWVEEQARHAVDRALHVHRIDEAVKEGAPFVVYEAITAIEGEKDAG